MVSLLLIKWKNLISQPALLVMKSTPRLIFIHLLREAHCCVPVDAKRTLREPQTPAAAIASVAGAASSHLIGHHVEEVVVDASAAHPLSGRHRAPELLLLGYQSSTFGHELPA